jgi:arabinose-5-phosphate isomerase
MNHSKLKDSNYLVEDTATLEDAMVAMTLNQRGAVIVVSPEGMLLGIVSDGDMRRALLQHITLIAPVTKVLNMNVLSLEEGEDVSSRAEEIFQERSEVNLLPILNKENKVVDIIVRNPDVRKDF